MGSCSISKSISSGVNDDKPERGSSGNGKQFIGGPEQSLLNPNDSIFSVDSARSMDHSLEQEIVRSGGSGSGGQGEVGRRSNNNNNNNNDLYSITETAEVSLRLGLESNT